MLLLEVGADMNAKAGKCLLLSPGFSTRQLSVVKVSLPIVRMSRNIQQGAERT